MLVGSKRRSRWGVWSRKTWGKVGVEAGKVLPLFKEREKRKRACGGREKGGERAKNRGLVAEQKEGTGKGDQGGRGLTWFL